MPTPRWPSGSQRQNLLTDPSPAAKMRLSPLAHMYPPPYVPVEGGSSYDVGAIAGGTAGGVLLVIIAIFCLVRRRRRKSLFTST